jgi:glucose-6-phosphate 1-epimerase
VTDQTGLASGCIGFKGEFDRVYAAAPSALTLHDGTHGLQIAQSASFADTVVWNPGAELCGRLGDMPPDGFARMLCVEAAQVMTPVEVAAGQTWQGWQRLTVI